VEGNEASEVMPESPTLKSSLSVSVQTSFRSRGVEHLEDVCHEPRND